MVTRIRRVDVWDLGFLRRLSAWGSLSDTRPTTRSLPHSAASSFRATREGDSRVPALKPYCTKRDLLLYRPWAVYLATLVLWSYGYARDGPPGADPSPNYSSNEHRMRSYSLSLPQVSRLALEEPHTSYSVYTPSADRGSSGTALVD